ncbi:glycosyl transferase [Bacillus thuringiensis serovar brasilensis]|uniref:glycosyltransferase n=1 Tax=Bacillus cereus group TaxID=86661 RepID=UPI000A3A8E0F|nr:glycosyltransferase [Bacillus thuringiensis]MCU5030161.1 glycosyltransferase [Bacillus cereus]MRA71124.1 glycosyltransferase [Bacillus thuringiensis]MRA90534.1 glycosyltransferase [Bacillus thuringiensis]MRC53085.1 glycosyltransferase [Bacillus thuringiensis]OTX32400.1 glycosyl transferase [Bacillus thuringiensis serovar brasilensis]
MLISLIIPVYNAEKFLPRCLDSVKNQTYNDLEIILVNDGSTDNSGLICDEYAKKDKRFTVIHKENGGVSSARNVGLNVASGKYIGFVDPDDWIETTMFEKLYQLIEKNKADIVTCGYIRETVDGIILNKDIESDIKILNQKEALNTIINPNGFRGFLWNKLFSVDVLNKDFKIYFDENIHFCEDLLFCCQAILNSRNMVYDSTPYYHYIIHSNNASQSRFSPKKLTALKALINVINLLKTKEEIKIEEYKNYFMHMNISLLMNGMQEERLEKESYKELKGNLYRFNISDLTNKFVKLSCIIARLNINLYYFIWKKTKKI